MKAVGAEVDGRDNLGRIDFRRKPGVFVFAGSSYLFRPV